jgi:hypothetical protein
MSRIQVRVGSVGAAAQAPEVEAVDGATIVEGEGTAVVELV